MKIDSEPVVVNILDKEYKVACPEGERDALLMSAQIIDQKMRDIRDGGKVIGTDRVAVMAALNVAHDLLRQRQALDNTAHDVGRRARALQERIDSALGPMSRNPVDVGDVSS